jgi:glycosyltransferase involved in cell wall biosynthesis
MEKICVIGYPSKLGGADTELDHQIRIWQKIGFEVNLLHTCIIDKNLQDMRMEERGCKILTPEKWEQCKDMLVISYCNGQFLKHLDKIKQYAKKVLWVNCMPWLFGEEKNAHKKGLIDYFIYQTDHARIKVQDELIELNPNFNWIKVKPYFYKDAFKFIKNRPEDKFRFGRISRADPGKFAPWTYWLYNTMVSPVLKEGHILGINDNVRKKIGNEPDWIKCYDAGTVPVQSIYEKIECFISPNDNYENLPRVAFESMASGCLLIVDNKGGWAEQVEHGVTGWLCSSDREYAYYSSRAAFESKERKQMIQNAYDWLILNWGEQQAIEEWTKCFNEVMK